MDILEFKKKLEKFLSSYKVDHVEENLELIEKSLNRHYRNGTFSKEEYEIVKTYFDTRKSEILKEVKEIRKNKESEEKKNRNLENNPDKTNENQVAENIEGENGNKSLKKQWKEFTSRYITGPVYANTDKNKKELDVIEIYKGKIVEKNTPGNQNNTGKEEK